MEESISGIQHCIDIQHKIWVTTETTRPTQFSVHVSCRTSTSIHSEPPPPPQHESCLKNQHTHSPYALSPFHLKCTATTARVTLVATGLMVFPGCADRWFSHQCRTSPLSLGQLWHQKHNTSCMPPWFHNLHPGCIFPHGQHMGNITLIFFSFPKFS